VLVPSSRCSQPASRSSSVRVIFRARSLRAADADDFRPSRPAGRGEQPGEVRRAQIQDESGREASGFPGFPGSFRDAPLGVFDWPTGRRCSNRPYSTLHPSSRILPAASGIFDSGFPASREADICEGPRFIGIQSLVLEHFLLSSSAVPKFPEDVSVIEPQRPAAPLQPAGGLAQHRGIALLTMFP